MIEKKVEIINKLGLHLRASALFVQLASKFKSNIEVGKDDQNVNAKSIMGVMSLAANQGSKIHIRCAGDDEAEAMKALEELVKSKFGEPN